MTLIVRTLLLSLLLCGPLSAKVPVEDFFKDPEFTSVSLSPTGEYLAVSVPKEDRTGLVVLRVSDMQRVSSWDHGANKHVDHVVWVSDDRLFMYVSQKLGRYDFRLGHLDVYASDADGKRRSVIPTGGSYQIIDTLEDDRAHVLVQRSVESTFLSRLNVQTGQPRTVAMAPVRLGEFLVDHSGQLRFVTGIDRGMNNVVLRRVGDSWTEVHREKGLLGDVSLRPIGFDRDGKLVHMLINQEGKTEKLYLVDPETGDRSLVSGNANVDPLSIIRSSDRRDILGVRYEDGLPSIEFVNAAHPEAQTLAGILRAFPDHDVSFRGISRDGRKVLFLAYSDVDPGSYYLFDRETNRAQFLLSARNWIRPEQMSPMRPISFQSRDGRTVHGYLTVPSDSAGRNLPLVLHPHGGPVGVRDYWEFNPEVQFLASRGYAVLQVNYRGSGGYGSEFQRAGYRGYGTVMIDDMADAVEWVVREGIADGDRICTYGASYGAFAAMQSVARVPGRYKCAIGLAGLYDLELWARDSDTSRSDFGRTSQEEILPVGAAERRAHSPAHNATRINVPVMLAHGRRDERTPISQYNAMRNALVAAGNPPEVEIVEPREGHGFYNRHNQLRLFQAIEAFLDKHIGGGASTAAN